MIEVHSHILPGIDDGARNLQESLRMVHEYHSNGFSVIIATPHIKDGVYNTKKSDVIEAVGHLNVELALVDIKVDIYAGAEYFMDIRILRDIENDSVVTLGRSRNVLVEFPNYTLPKHSYTIVDLLIENDYLPILAHPERCKDIHSGTGNELEWFLDRGCKLQIDVQSLLGNNGRNAMKMAWNLIKKQRVTSFGFDAHRPIVLQKTFQGFDGLLKRFPEYSLKSYFLNNEKILNGRDISLPS